MIVNKSADKISGQEVKLELLNSRQLIRQEKLILAEISLEPVNFTTEIIQKHFITSCSRF